MHFASLFIVASSPKAKASMCFHFLSPSSLPLSPLSRTGSDRRAVSSRETSTFSPHNTNRIVSILY